MTKNLVYENAPLVEVIAEMHWDLRILDSATNVRTDPYYYPFQDGFIEEAKQDGFEYVEDVVQSFLPLEHTPGRPRLRLRKKPNTWPVIQIGPGIVTANIAPPYGGWSEFASFLQTQVRRAIDVRTQVGESPSVNKLYLRYIDAFGESFNFKHFSSFAREMLGIEVPLSQTFIQEYARATNEFAYLLDVTFQCKAPAHSQARLKVGLGKRNEEDALILELSCETQMASKIQKKSHIKDWFTQAHTALRRQFHGLTTPQLRKLMGELQTPQTLDT